MKTLSFIAFCLFISTAITSCADNDHRFVDLETGKHINVVKDSANGYMVNADTKEPVIIYVDTETKDTIYGKTGKVINDHVIKTEEGKYKYVSNDDMKSDDGSYKIKDGDYKKKVEADGDIKIKDGDTKIKIDGETGEKKVKKD
ncbi:MAG: hypothetical protein ABI691_00325 [Ginsengibacter sp.]